MKNLQKSHDEFFEWLIQYITPDEIMAFQMSQESRERIQDIIDRRSAGDITSEEEAELQQAVDFEHMILLIKAKAYGVLNSRP